MSRRLRYAARLLLEEFYLTKGKLNLNSLRTIARALFRAPPEGDCRSCGKPTRQEDIPMPDGSVQPAFCMSCVILDRLPEPQWRN